MAAATVWLAVAGGECRAAAGPSPGQVVQRFYAAVNAGDYAAARALMAPSYQASFVDQGKDVFEEAMEGRARVGDRKVERIRGLVGSVEITKETIAEPRAAVIIKLTKTTGESRQEKFWLARLGGQWKIAQVSEP